MLISLKNTLEDNFEQDRDLKVAIIGGVAGNFCSGYDLNELLDPISAMPNIQIIEQMLWPLGTRLSDSKITIAAIDGHAAGFGFELALKCDFRVAERDSRMGFMNRRFGIPIMNGGTVILPKLLGFARGIELVASGKAQLAPDALQQGTITHIADVGCCLGRSLSLARSLAKFPHDALIHDLNQVRNIERIKDFDLLRQERAKSLEYLKHSGPLENALKFIRGQLGRHGNMDMGNLMEPIPEVTL